MEVYAPEQDEEPIERPLNALTLESAMRRPAAIAIMFAKFEVELGVRTA